MYTVVRYRSTRGLQYHVFEYKTIQISKRIYNLDTWEIRSGVEGRCISLPWNILRKQVVSDLNSCNLQFAYVLNT